MQIVQPHTMLWCWWKYSRDPTKYPKLPWMMAAMDMAEEQARLNNPVECVASTPPNRSLMPSPVPSPVPSPTPSPTPSPSMVYLSQASSVSTFIMLMGDECHGEDLHLPPTPPSTPRQEFVVFDDYIEIK